MKTKVLIFIPSIVNCGPTNVVLALIENLELDNFDVHLVYLWGENNIYLDLLKRKCSKIYKLQGISVKSLISLFKLVIQLQPALIHSHCLIPDIFTYFLKLTSDVKVMSTVHCNLKEDYKREYGKLKSNLFFFIHKNILKRFHKVITVSESASRCLEFKNETIYNGVNKNTIKKVRGLKGECNLVFVGRLINRKKFKVFN